MKGLDRCIVDCAHEVPLFREFPYTVAMVTPQFANEQPDVVRRIAQTLGQANDMFHTNFGEAVDILKKLSPEHSRQSDRTRLGTRAGQLSTWRPDDSNDVGEQHQGGHGSQDDFVRCSEPRGRTVDEQVPELTNVAMLVTPEGAWAVGDSCNG